MNQDYVEQMIFDAQKTGGTIHFDEDNHEAITSILAKLAKIKMLSYDLIIQDEKGNYLLNKRGINFKSFKIERRRQWLEQRPFFRDLRIVLISAILSLVSGYILYRLSIRESHQSEVELKNQLRDVNLRLDSLTNHRLLPAILKDSL